MIDTDHPDLHRPLGLTLLTGLYLFFFLLSASTFGHPFPLVGHIFQDATARMIVFIDSLICLYLFLGIMKRQLLTWYLLIGYNMAEIVNTIVNLSCISQQELEKVLVIQINTDAMRVNNIAASLAILLLTQFIYRNKHYFIYRQKYLF